MFFGQFAGEPYSTGSAQAVMRAIKKSGYQRTQQYIPYGTVCHSFIRKWDRY
jgi:hypothetical protein